MSDTLEAEWRQQTRQDSQQADDVLTNQTQGLFDFSQEKFITLPKYKEDTKFEFDISPPPSSATTSTTTRSHPSRCTRCSPTRTMTTSCSSKQP